MNAPDFEGGGGWFNHQLMTLVMHADLPPAEKHVLVVMGWHGDYDGARIYPGVRRLAKLTGYARSTTEIAIAQLIGKRLVTVTRKGSQKQTNAYAINVPELRKRQLDGVPLVGTAPQPIYQQGVPVAGTGVSREVSREVSRWERFSVPVIGTEQTPTTQQEEQGEENIENEEQAKAIWAAALAEVSQRVNRQSFDTWFRPLRAIGLSGGRLYLKAPNMEFTHGLDHPEWDARGAVLRAAAAAQHQTQEGHHDDDSRGIRSVLQ